MVMIFLIGNAMRTHQVCVECAQAANKPAGSAEPAEAGGRRLRARETLEP